jgi:carbohydrate-binding DOMON domain-containing protein
VPQATTHVTGTAAPRARIVVAATNTDTGAPSTVVAATASSSGAFDVTVPTTFGTTVITTTATTGNGTAYDQRKVASELITGTTVFDTTDPAGDDHGPGTFQYPLSGDFHDGAFDLLRFQVIDGGDTIYLRTTLRDLTPTFGDPLGAELLTVFARDPADASTSTQPFFASRNYTVDPWTRAIQVRGFEAPRFVDAAFNPLGAISVQASAVTKTITILAPKAAFGTPAAGWTWNVILHGQDGFGQDGARTFTATPENFTFGRCATAAATPPCQVPLDQLPKAMDVLGTNNLDRSQGPVVIHAVE